jgi:alcohol dehydrogenase (cytochrome c)
MKAYHRFPWNHAGSVCVLLLVTALFSLSAASAPAKSAGGYTDAQAARGAAVYNQSCLQCHGSHLEGQSGPALSGQALKSAYGAGTAEPLYDFISRQMPQDAPGSLSQAQYLDVTAFILSKNGFPTGAKALTTASLKQIRMSSQSMTGAAQTSNTDEIVRAAPPVRTVYAPLPTGANVNITDSMMGSAQSNDNDWLLHGRTYWRYRRDF